MVCQSQKYCLKVNKRSITCLMVSCLIDLFDGHASFTCAFWYPMNYFDFLPSSIRYITDISTVTITAFPSMPAFYIFTALMTSVCAGRRHCKKERIMSILILNRALTHWSQNEIMNSEKTWVMLAVDQFTKEIIKQVLYT